jgi:hypothetical protein
MFHSFTAASVGVVRVTLASLATARVGEASSAVVGVGFGVPNETGCTLRESTNTAPALTAQVVTAATPAAYCVQISDIGNLAGPINFAIRIVYPG